MSNAVEYDISRALFERIDGHEFSQPVRVSWPGAEFVPEAGTWLGVTIHYTGVDQITLGDAGLNRYTGFLRVDVNTPAGNGLAEPLNMAAEVVALFRRGTEIQIDGRWIRAILPPQLSDPLEFNGWIRVPVTVRWQSDNQNVS